MLNLSSMLAKPYAKAAFEFANENDLLKEWSALLKVFSELMQNNSIKNIIASPIFSQSQIMEALRTHLTAEFFNFVALLAKTKKLILLPLICEQFHAIKNAQNNKKIAKIVLPYYKVDKSILSDLKVSLEKKFNCSIDLDIVVNPAIIGGVIVTIGDTVIDSSISGRLEKLKNILSS